jgi:hypothetical protein
MKELLALAAACVWAVIWADGALAQRGQHSGKSGSSSSSSGSPTYGSQYIQSGSGSSTKTSTFVQKVQGSTTTRRITGSGSTTVNAKGNLAKVGITGQGQRRFTPANQQKITEFMKSGSVSPDQKGALNRLQAGENLTSEDRSVLTDMLANDPKLDAETREAIQHGLEDDLENRMKTGSPHTQRYLKIKNDTKDTLTVYVQYRTQDKSEQWVWLPVNPKQSAEAVTQSLAPGKEILAEVEKNPILSSRVRLWAKSAAGGTQWLEYKDHDLWLVPEVDREKPKDHIYYAPKTETFVFAFKS